MNDWTSGYVAEVPYTYGYYSELDPLRMKLAFIDAGIVAPNVETACELGFGQGVSVNVHAAASDVSWFGTDFNPSQASFAQELAAAAGSGARLYDEAFEAFCARNDLPDFDFIGVHGIWTWISDANRSVIVDFVRRKLKVGGVLYISYNIDTGWAPVAPFRDLLADYVRIMGRNGQGLLPNVEEAFAFADKLLAVKPGYAIVNPRVVERFNMIKEQERNYVAHEFFNREWSPMSFSRMTDWLAPTKTSFGCSALYTDHLPHNMTPEQQALLPTIPDVTLREMVRDFCVNQQFRRDYWVKGLRRLDPVDQAEAVRSLRVVLAMPRSDVTLKVKTGAGELRLKEEIYNPVLDALVGHVPKSVGEVERAVKEKGVNLQQVQRAIMVLAAKGDLMLIQDDHRAKAREPFCRKLNAHILRKAVSGGTMVYLASPLTAGAFPVDRFQQLFLLARSQGNRTPEEWARAAWRTMSAQGQRLLKEGKTVESDEDNLTELISRAKAFAEKRLNLLQALQIC